MFGHEGPIIRGNITKPVGKSNTLIEGNVDGLKFEFNVEIECKHESYPWVCK